MKKINEKWVYESFKHPFEKVHQANFRIYENNLAAAPVCSFPISLSDIQSKPLLERQKEAVGMMVNAPEMYQGIIKLLSKITKETVVVEGDGYLNGEDVVLINNIITELSELEDLVNKVNKDMIL